ncbi:MAG: O-antigen ligase family protein [Vicinamibacterales bacterium]
MAAGPAITQRLDVDVRLEGSDAARPHRHVAEGEHMVRDHPLVGVGPNMIEMFYPKYRVAEAVEQINPHLHNVPMQIAAERGLAGAGAVALVHRRARVLRARHCLRQPTLAADPPRAHSRRLVADARRRTIRYNFGDSEFLMLLLLLITLPFACARDTAPDPTDA